MSHNITRCLVSKFSYCQCHYALWHSSQIICTWLLEGHIDFEQAEHTMETFLSSVREQRPHRCFLPEFVEVWAAGIILCWTPNNISLPAWLETAELEQMVSSAYVAWPMSSRVLWGIVNAVVCLQIISILDLCTTILLLYECWDCCDINNAKK